MTNSFTVYDVVLNNAQKIDQQEVAKLDPKVNASYTQKEDEQTIYYLSEQFEQMPFIVKEGMNGDRNIKPKNKEITATQLAQELTLQDSLREYELPEQQPKEIKLVSQEEFSQLNLPETTLQLIQVTDFDKQLSNLEKLVAENKANNEELKNVDYSFTQKADVYNTFNSMFSGFEFMGFFLGLAFLTMLASCLMFKILSGSKSDQVRYEMLQKIGTRQGLLTQSIRREIGVLFLAPGLLGVVHVLFGLQMFKLLMSDPYDNLWLPFTIFFVLYFVYYVITTWLYTGIVLKKKA